MADNPANEAPLQWRSQLDQLTQHLVALAVETVYATAVIGAATWLDGLLHRGTLPQVFADAFGYTHLLVAYASYVIVAIRGLQRLWRW